MNSLRRSVVFLLALTCTLTLCLPAVSFAQAKAAPKVDPKDEPKLPEPEDITRDTKDGVALKMTYFAGTLGKKSAPIILLHGWGGQRGDMEGLALSLQKLGHACLTLDMRGHGQSMKFKGAEKDLNKDDFRLADLVNMGHDIETGKRFLLEKNNLGECNIEALGIVACDVNCLMAMRWCVADWNAPVLPAFKQGQDVKALVLLSPANSHKGLNALDFLTNTYTRKNVSVMLVAGKEDGKSLTEAKRLKSKLQTFHPKETGDNEVDRKSGVDLFLVDPVTKLQGSELLNPALKVGNNIANFFNLRLVEKQDTYSWSDRKSPL